MSRLRTRLAVASSLLILFIVSSITCLLVLREKRALRSQLEANSRVFANLTAGWVRQAYASYGAVDKERLREAIAKLSGALPALVRLEILDQRGQMLFAFEGSRAGPRIGLLPANIMDRIAAVELTMEEGIEDGHEVLDIISSNPEEGLAVRYIVSYGFAKEQLRGRVRELFLIAFLSIAIGAGIAILLSRIMTAPLIRLSKAAQRAREADLGRLAAVEAGDEVEGVVKAFNCICDQLRKNVESSERAHRELQKVDQLKSEFLANVSHELRTPLTSIRGYVDYILEGKMGEINDAQRRGLEVVQRNLVRLKKRVESLLALSKEEIHPDELQVRPFSLAPLVEELLREVEPESEGKGLVLELDIPDDLPPLLADRERISQAMENLLSNAIKFTPEGGQIKVKAREVSVDHRRHISVWVSDTGIGIQAEELPRIFDRFHQTDASSRRKYPGIGLGLSIVKQIVDRHSGKIQVESEEGKGTTFQLLLPAY